MRKIGIRQFFRVHLVQKSRHKAKSAVFYAECYCFSLQFNESITATTAAVAVFTVKIIAFRWFN